MVFAVLEFMHIIPSDLGVVEILAAALLGGTVFAAVHHAEMIALRIGEPFGSMLLAVAVTVIEVSLIISIMLAKPEAGSDIARDTVFAAVMLVLTGIVGFCLLAGGLRHHEQGFGVNAASGTLSVLGTLATLALILPNFTVAEPGPHYSTWQLIGVAAVSLFLYLLFLFVQSFRHRDYFLDPNAPAHEVEHARPSARAALISLLLLIVALVAIVLIAKGLSPALERGVAAAGLPSQFVGIIIAAVVLMPEGVTAFNAARSNNLQQSLNLALGSALASIGLTIPAVAMTALALGIPLTLGLDSADIVLLALALFTATLTLATGRTTVLQGGVHLVLFATFLIISAIP
ncbi:calcium:proton antiporter [Acuticoccus sp. MNP-M23]|uniref:calcium:proton antiporter n=1 Tax=Acuticoccus sp. MNP-M23 TaxID=3072793 RepID=UPI0035C1BCD8